MYTYAIITKIYDMGDPDGSRDRMVKLIIGAKSKREAIHIFREFVRKYEREMIDEWGGYSPEIWTSDKNINVINWSNTPTDCKVLINSLTSKEWEKIIYKYCKKFMKERSKECKKY